MSGQIRINVSNSRGVAAAIIVPFDRKLFDDAYQANLDKGSLRFRIDNTELIKDPVARQLIESSFLGHPHVAIPKGWIRGVYEV